MHYCKWQWTLYMYVISWQPGRIILYQQTLEMLLCCKISSIKLQFCALLQAKVDHLYAWRNEPTLRKKSEANMRIWSGPVQFNWKWNEEWSLRTAANAIYVKKFEKKNQDFNWIVWASFFQTSLCNFMIVYTAVRIILRFISAVINHSHSTENIVCSN